jgi:O-antigen/teichoic acid export membrane protein
MPTIAAAFSHTLVIRAAGFAIGFVNSIVVVRALGPEGRGALSLLLTAGMFLTLLLGPFAAANTILLGREPRTLRPLTVNSLLGALAAGLLCGILFLVVPASTLATLLGVTSVTLLALLTVLVTLQVFGGALNGLLLGRQEFFLTNNASLLNGGLVLLLNGVLIVVLGLQVAGALIAMSIGWVVVIGIYAARLRQAPEWALEPRRVDRSRMFQGLGIGGRAILANLPAVLMLRSDIFLVQLYLGIAPVGVYSVGVSIAEMVLIIGSALNSIAYAKAASEPNSSGGIARAARLAFAVSLLVWLGLALVAPWFFPAVYGAAFAGAALPATIMLAGIVAWNLQTPLSGYIVGRESYPLSHMAAVLAGFIVNLALNVVLIPIWQLNGAATATAVAYSFTAVLMIAHFGRLTGTPMRALVAPGRADFLALRNVVAGTLSRRAGRR